MNTHPRIKQNRTAAIPGAANPLLPQKKGLAKNPAAPLT